MKRGLAVLLFVAGAVAWGGGEAAGAQPPGWSGARNACNSLQQREAWQQCVNRACGPIKDAREKTSCVQRGNSAHDSGLLKQVADIRAKVKPEQDKLAGMQKQLADIKKRMGDTQQQITKLRLDVAGHDKRVKQLRGQVMGLEGSIRGQRSEIERQCGPLRDPKRKKDCEDRIQAKIKTLEQQLQGKRKELFPVQDRLRNLQSKLGQQEKNLSGYNQTAKTKQSQFQAQQRAIDRLKQQGKKLCGGLWDKRLVPGCVVNI